MLKKIFRRVRKGIRDIGSHVEDNPLEVLAAAGLGFGAGILPGGEEFGLATLFDNLGKAGNIGRNLIGCFDKVVPGGKDMGNVLQEGIGILGTAQNLLGGLGGIKELFPVINAYLAKQQYEQEREDILREREEQREKMEFVSNKYDSPVGGST